jgi:Fe2+ transport system protein FeoA
LLPCLRLRGRQPGTILAGTLAQQAAARHCPSICQPSDRKLDPKSPGGILNLHRKLRREHHHRQHTDLPGEIIPLSEVEPGSQVTVMCFSDSLPPERWTRLVAYGISPGSRLLVVQQKPVVVLQVEYSQIALDRELAGRIIISTQ